MIKKTSKNNYILDKGYIYKYKNKKICNSVIARETKKSKILEI